MWETQQLAHRNADIVTTLMRASGGGAQRLEHPMQRYFRDINAAVAHAFLNVDRGSLQFAQAALAAVTSDAKLVEVGEVRATDGMSAFVVAAGEQGRLATGAATVTTGAHLAAAVAAVRAGRALTR